MVKLFHLRIVLIPLLMVKIFPNNRMENGLFFRIGHNALKLVEEDFLTFKECVCLLWEEVPIVLVHLF